MEKTYICIDLKSFYASVECVERSLDPLDTNLVVADKTRSNKTVCLAITPSLKQYGLKGRARLFEVLKKIKEVNYQRRKENNYQKYLGKSYLDSELKKNKEKEVAFIIAPPRMKKYMEYSAFIYNIYLKYLSKDDIFPYSIDEVFCDITNYLHYYNLTAQEFVSKIIKDVYEKTKITATAGIGSNLYLAKVAMDIVAKHQKPNEIGVRIATLDEISYRKLLWHHLPLTDFWRIGKGISKKLEENEIYTMGDIARLSLTNENFLYKLFGVNAEILIDHAWGYEMVTIKDIKNYQPENQSISKGQVLPYPYPYQKAKLIVMEMIESLSLELVKRNKVTNQLAIKIGYEFIKSDEEYLFKETTTDIYGRKILKSPSKIINLKFLTSSSKILTEKALELFDEIVLKEQLLRKINITACNLKDKDKIEKEPKQEQLDIFSLTEDKIKTKKALQQEYILEDKLQHTLLNIKAKYGKNAIIKGMDLEDGATTILRNKQVGGHMG